MIPYGAGFHNIPVVVKKDVAFLQFKKAQDSFVIFTTSALNTHKSLLAMAVSTKPGCISVRDLEITKIPINCIFSPQMEGDGREK